MKYFYLWLGCYKCYCFIALGNIVGITARGGDEGTFGAHKPRKGMFRTVAQFYKVTFPCLLLCDTDILVTSCIID